MSPGYRPIRSKPWIGRLLEGTEWPELLERIDRCRRGETKTFYQPRAYRKTFYDPDRNWYIKIETPKPSRKLWARVWGGESSRRFFKFNRIVAGLGIPAPRLVASLLRRERGIHENVIITEGLAGVRALNELLPSVNARSARQSIMKGLAAAASAIHAAGYYLSLDLQNFVGKVEGNEARLFILDLDHMKKARRLGRRTVVQRNLERLHRSLLAASPTGEEDWQVFLRDYA